MHTNSELGSLRRLLLQAEAEDEEMEERGGTQAERDQRAVKPGYESDEEPGTRHQQSHRTPTPQPGPAQPKQVSRLQSGQPARCAWQQAPSRATERPSRSRGLRSPSRCIAAHAQHGAQDAVQSHVTSSTPAVLLLTAESQGIS